MNKTNQIIIFITVAIFIAACGAPKPIRKPIPTETLPEIESKIVFNPKTNKYDTLYVNTKVDTVRWKPAPPKTTPPIGTSTKPTSKPDNKPDKNKPTVPVDYGKKPTTTVTDVKAPKNSVFRSVYNITYALPFYTDKFSELDKEIFEKSDWALNFYAGAKLALDTLEKEGIVLKINVLDTKANENEMAIVLAAKETQKADVIIGAETRKNVETTAAWAKQNDKIFISPYNPSADIVFDNKQFVQLNPSLQTYCEAIMQNALKTKKPDQITVIVRDKANEREALQYLQQANQKAGNAVRLREIIVDEKAGLVAIDVKSNIRAGVENAFIVPIWNNETFIYSLLKKIENAKGKNNVTVYGMPQWANFQVNGYDAFEALQAHIPMATFIDSDATAVKSFKKAFFYKYDTAPDDEAYRGYDITLYTGRMLQKYGTKFNEIMDQLPYQGVETNFNFQKEKSLQADFERLDTYDRWANKYLSILKFENGFFKKVD
jgi:Periplasmic binding protein